ncbi:MAG: class I SAM-dependent methyltransferase [Bacteroidia bacterium]|nr:class I SAM-dependent methyltransferase [Bacteroidia bacterium]
MENNKTTEFDIQYQQSSEPWDYSSSGAELLRYQTVLELAKQFCPSPTAVLDVGCSLGLFTQQLIHYSPSVMGIDISPTAIQKCRDKYPNIQFEIASLSSAQLPENSLDVIFYCDGLWGHQLSDAEIQKAMENIRLFLKPGGVAIFTDYIGHKQFANYRKMIQSYPFEILYDEPLHDRLWFQMKSLFKAIRKLSFIKKLLSSVTIASYLANISKLRGESGSKHICVVIKNKK